MEIPVMTSASTHSLRSAVGACAKPTSSFLNSSDYPGGCLKKIINNVNKSDSSSFLNKLNFTKKRKSTSDCGIRCKKNKNLNNKTCSTQSFTTKSKNGKIKNVHIGCYREEIPKKYTNVILNGFPKRLNCPNEFLSKIKSNEFFDKKVSSGINEAFFNSNLVRTVHNVNNSSSTNNESSANNNNNNNENIGSCNIPTTNSSAATTSTSSAHVISNNDNNNNNNNSNNNNNNSKKSIKIKKNNISDLGGVNSNVNSISISDVTRRPEKCGSSELVNVSNEEGRRESDGPLTWQPKHLVTRRTAQISREVLSAWQARFGSSSSLTARQVSLLLQDLQLPFPKSQVYKTLEPAGKEISFEEFCDSLEESRRNSRIPPSTPTPRQFGKNGSHQQIRGSRKLSKTMCCKYEVFLGGSCNPTTWRTDIAIPDLKQMGITYFNPQVSQWQPSLLEVEYSAKENAVVMFFVIDNQTRGISTLVEVAHIAGSKRSLILVIQSYTQENQMICGETISQQECKDLRNGQEVLRDLVEGQGIRVFDNIRVALKCTEKLVRNSATAVDEADVKEPPEELPLRKPIELREAFDALVTSESGNLTFKDACLAVQLFTEKRVVVKRIKDIAEKSGLENQVPVCLEEQSLNFEQFCSLVDAVSSQESEESFQGSGVCIYPQLASDTSPSTPIRDVFLGGTHQDTSWKEDIAIPMLKTHGLTYFNPRLSEWNERFLPIEAAAMKNSYILLLVISNSARSIAEMVVAGYYIGLGAKMVLCIQNFANDATVGMDKLSENAVKDYNRGRKYLMDIAGRNGVKTFTNVEDAVQCVIGAVLLRGPPVRHLLLRPHVGGVPPERVPEEGASQGRHLQEGRLRWGPLAVRRPTALLLLLLLLFFS